MNRLTLPASLVAIAVVVAGCSAASGPTFNAYSIDTGDGARTYRVECGGIFESAATCTKIAERICGKKSVQPIQKIDRLRSADDSTTAPRALIFKCEAPTVEAAPVSNVQEAPRIEEFTLQTDALFPFDRSSLDSMLPAGKAELDKAIERINSYKEATEITIIGHTDRIGPATVNQALSFARADTVRAYLVAHGVDSSFIIHTQGVGSSQPISHCPNGPSTTLIACLQPDRRVSVVVHGPN